MNIATFSAWISYYILPDKKITASFCPIDMVSAGKN